MVSQGVRGETGAAFGMAGLVLRTAAVSVVTPLEEAVGEAVE